MNIKKKLFTSGIWWVAANLFNGLSTMIVFVVLARLLTPQELGIVAFATAFVEFSRVLVTAGISDAMVQRKEWDQLVASTAFWINTFLGALVTLILCGVVAPIAAHFYDPQFPEVLICLSILLLVEGCSVVHTAQLRREFRAKTLAHRNMISSIVASVLGITLAFMGWGVWAMVVSRLAGSAMASFLLWRASAFRPSFHFSWDDLRSFRRFSSLQFGSQLLSTGNTQFVALIVGAFLGPAGIAQYQVGARALNMLTRLIVAPLQTAAMPAFARVHHGGGTVASAYLRVTAIAAIVTCPFFFGMAAMAPDLVRIVFGPQWREAGFVMMTLALVVGPATLSYFIAPALTAVGKSGLNFMTNLSAFISNAIVTCLTVSFGPVVVASGNVGRAHLSSPLSLRFLDKGIGVRPMQALANIAPPYLCGAVMGGGVFALRAYVLADWSEAARVTVCLTVGVSLYATLILLFARGFLRRQLNELHPMLPNAPGRFLAKVAARL